MTFALRKYKDHSYVNPLNAGNLKNILGVLVSFCPLNNKRHKYEKLILVFHVYFSMARPVLALISLIVRAEPGFVII